MTCIQNMQRSLKTQQEENTQPDQKIGKKS